MVKQPKQTGFTMIELVITVAVVAVIATFAIPGYQQMVENSKIRTVAESILTGLQLARAEAVKRNENVQVEFAAGNAAGWTVCLQPTPAGACASTIRSRPQQEGSAGNVTVVDGGAGGPYVFNSLGQLVSPAGPVTITIDNAAMAAADSRQLEVRIAVGGSVRSCDPNLAAGGTDPRRCTP